MKGGWRTLKMLSLASLEPFPPPPPPPALFTPSLEPPGGSKREGWRKGGRRKGANEKPFFPDEVFIHKEKVCAQYVCVGVQKPQTCQVCVPGSLVVFGRKAFIFVLKNFES